MNRPSAYVPIAGVNSLIVVLSLRSDRGRVMHSLVVRGTVDRACQFVTTERSALRPDCGDREGPDSIVEDVAPRTRVKDNANGEPIG